MNKITKTEFCQIKNIKRFLIILFLKKSNNFYDKFSANELRVEHFANADPKSVAPYAPKEFFLNSLNKIMKKVKTE